MKILSKSSRKIFAAMLCCILAAVLLCSCMSKVNYFVLGEQIFKLNSYDFDSSFTFNMPSEKSDSITVSGTAVGTVYDNAEQTAELSINMNAEVEQMGALKMGVDFKVNNGSDMYAKVSYDLGTYKSSDYDKWMYINLSEFKDDYSENIPATEDIPDTLSKDLTTKAAVEVLSAIDEITQNSKQEIFSEQDGKYKLTLTEKSEEAIINAAKDFMADSFSTRYDNFVSSLSSQDDKDLAAKQKDTVQSSINDVLDNFVVAKSPYTLTTSLSKSGESYDLDADLNLQVDEGATINLSAKVTPQSGKTIEIPQNTTTVEEYMQGIMPKGLMGGESALNSYSDTDFSDDFEM